MIGICSTKDDICKWIDENYQLFDTDCTMRIDICQMADIKETSCVTYQSNFPDTKADSYRMIDVDEKDANF